MTQKGGLSEHKLFYEEVTNAPSYEFLRKASTMARRSATKLRNRLHGVLPGKGIHGDDRKVK